ncbi:beta-propeller domain-containing protein [Clostridium sp. JNZ X4-2]
MKIFMRVIFYAAAFLNIFALSGCISTKNKYKSENIDMPNYSDVTVIESKDSGGDIFNIKNSRLLKKGSADNIWDIQYNVQEPVYVYLVGMDKAEQHKNKIVILYENTKNEIKDFFTAQDIKIDPSGHKIAYRTFKSSSADSAQGMKIYDIKNKKYIDFKSKVLISGNLYEWLDDHRIIYYGDMEGRKNSDKIYLYDFNKNKEEVYLDNTRGYCMYFTCIGGDLLFLSRDQDELNLYYYSHKSRQFQFLSDKFQQIYDSQVDKKRGDVFFIGKNDENIDSLYKFTQNSGKLSRITYDFPGQIAVSNGMAQDKSGNVYFIGTGDGENNEDVFMYSMNKKSVDIISDHEGKYNIYGEN